LPCGAVGRIYGKSSGRCRPRRKAGRGAGGDRGAVFAAALVAFIRLAGAIGGGAGRHGFDALFLLGVVTSVHCIAMCGGINLSQSLAGGGQKSRAAALLPALQYNAAGWFRTR